MRKVNGFNADQKILHYTDKLDYFFNGHKTLIVTELDLTNKCNNRCPSCCGVNENGAELTKEQLDHIMEGLSEMENRGVILSGGGEPLISPCFAHALQGLRRKGMRIGVNSNGLALTEEKAEMIARNCDYFRISLDAATPEMYAKTHGMPAGSFEQVIHNAKQFRLIRDQMFSETSFGVGFLTSEQTIEEMESFVRLCMEIGADFAQFRPFTGDLCNVEEPYLRLKEKYETEAFQVRASIQKYNFMEQAAERQYSKCRGMFFSTVITADAKVFACLHHRQEEQYLLGDLNEQSLEEIFLSPRIREVYKRIDCEQCPVLCRNDAINKILEQLAGQVINKEFL